MMEAIFALVGLVVGAAIAAAVFIARRGAAALELANARARGQMLDEQLRQRTTEADGLREAVVQAERSREAAERQAAVITEQLTAKQKQFEEQKRLLDEAERRLSDTFAALGAKALQVNKEQFIALAKKTFETLMAQASGDVEKKQQAIDALVKPIRELLDRQNSALTDLEKKREADKSGLQRHLELIAQAHDKLSAETARLVKALRRPEQRGRWGELQLRNVVELAGMTRHCDFNEQVTIWNGESAQRPDLVVNLPGRGVIPVDAKVAIDAYFDAIECEDGEARAHCLRRHADQVERHVKSLSQKRYWDGFAKTQCAVPEVVVMFMPLESALVAALEVKPELHHQAMQQHVLIATPTLLVALLRAVAYGWQQEQVAANAREISDCGKELYERLSRFAAHLERVGSGLTTAIKGYNDGVGSLERMVLPSARKLRELRGDASGEGELKEPPIVEIEARPIVAPELLTTRPLFEEEHSGVSETE